MKKLNNSIMSKEAIIQEERERILKLLKKIVPYSKFKMYKRMIEKEK